MTEKYDVVIAGAGHAGTQAAIALRQNGFEGSIGLFGDEELLPYERPPLSKDYLSQTKEFERILLRPASFWHEKGISLELGCRIARIDPPKNAVELDTGEKVYFGKLIWATGGRARRLACPGGDFDGLHTVRTKLDVDRMIKDINQGAKHVVIVGGGYIGLEAAAVLRKLNLQVTLLEALPRVLSRVAGRKISEFFEAFHRSQGVELRVSEAVDSIRAETGSALQVCLGSGASINCDMVVVGIGIDPEVEPIASAGGAISNGVQVDGYCQTSIPDIYAIGDCAEHPNPYASGNLIRLESVQNANDMATTAARHICGIGEPYSAVPWFWSNQYDIRLQTVGLSHGFDQEVVRGDPASAKFSVVYLREGRVIALDCVNSTKDYVQGRKLVEQGAVVRPEDLADGSRQLKELL